MSELKIKSLTVADWESSHYYALVSALGYESRAIAIAKMLIHQCDRGVAFGFDHNHNEAFERNFEWFQINKFLVLKYLDPTQFQTAFDSEIVKPMLALPATSVRRLAIDISCFDRLRIALIVNSVKKLCAAGIETHFFYSMAAFTAPSLFNGRNEVAGPVHRSFAGRFLDPSRPLALVAGLGYEVGKVVGAAEYVQAMRVIALVPESPIAEYEPEVIGANKLLIDDIPSQDVIKYKVDDPQRIVATLDSICSGLSSNHNLVLLPGGPKIFALACLLTHLIHSDTSVWRVSSGTSIHPRDVQASGITVALALTHVPN